MKKEEKEKEYKKKENSTTNKNRNKIYMYLNTSVITLIINYKTFSEWIKEQDLILCSQDTHFQYKNTYR